MFRWHIKNSYSGIITISLISSVLLLLSVINAYKVQGLQQSTTKTTTGDQQSQRIKVLVLRNNDAGKQQHAAIEEAASLSLDLPLQAETATTSRQQQQQNATTTTTQQQDDQSNQTSSLGYRQVSLASLTLHQVGSFDGSTTNTNQTTRLTRSEQQQQAQQTEPWASDLYLPRLKPTWLNVSNKFKITGESIEEIKDYMMPTEYLLRPAFDSPILLKTKLGIIEGVRSIKFNKHLYTFLSVPYAKPPIGEFRFKPPQVIEKWDGILQATKWPPFCVQPSMTLASKSSPVHVLTQIMTEDCLYLNIWTPTLKFNKNHKRPVMVWIHGGAFQYGGISVDENDGSTLALLGDVVVVTLNYRVSAFGFLNANNQLNAPNNVGILDQRAAMEWVQANIKQFGGDPQQVTLFGESAGGHSVGLHMISPGSQSLFKRAILQSGVPISLLRSYDINPDNRGTTVAEGVSSVMMAKRLKCYVPNAEGVVNDTAPMNEEGDSTTTTTTSSASGNVSTTAAAAAAAPPTTTTTTDSSGDGEDDSGGGGGGGEESDVDIALLNDETLDCMRNKSSLEILKAMGAPGNAGFFPTGNDLKGVFSNGPIMESFEPENLKIGPQKDYLIGTNTDEGTFMLHYGMPSLFPARDLPRVESVEALKKALKTELERMSKATVLSLNSSEIQSASGDNKQGGGAQAHLYKPLLRTSNSILESFMPKSQVRVLTNGTVVGNTTLYNKQAEFGKNVGSLITDIIFLCPARSLARTLSENGRNVYFYLYKHRSSQSQYHDWIGVTHHDEVEFVFGRPIRLADVYTGKDIEMSQRLIKIWSHFAYTGQMLDQFGVKWPKYGDEEGNYMNIEANEASIGQRYHDRVCNIYDTVITVHLTDN